MSRAVKAYIDLAAVEHNLQIVRQYAPQSKVLAVIKANGYGHGMVTIANALTGVDALGVACVEEARQLRVKGVRIPILLLAGCFSHDELEESAQQDLDIVVHQLEQVEALECVRLSRPLNVWLKLDTGMHRLGVSAEQFESAYKRLLACDEVAKVNVMSHFARADEPEHPETQQQIKRFDAVTAGLDCATSLANSAAIIKFPHARREWVRPGIMLYGVAPFAEESGEAYGLRPVMTLTSHLMAIRNCKRGDALGYGGAWRCPQDTRVGVVAVGYGDGYPRHAQEGTPVTVRGRRVPLIGRVSMDSIFVDLTHCPTARLGDEVVLWGRGLPVEEIAACSATIPYELLCKVTARVTFSDKEL